MLEDIDGCKKEAVPPTAPPVLAVTQALVTVKVLAVVKGQALKDHREISASGVFDVLPGGQGHPRLQGPLQAALDKPVVAP